MDGAGIDTTSFIPKRPLETRRVSALSLSGIFTFLSLVLLIASVGAYFAMYFREKSILTDTSNIEKIIQGAQDQFQPKRIVDMSRFDARLKLSSDLLYLTHDPRAPDLTMHITLQPLFKLLSDKTIKSVRFRDFKYTNIDNQKIDIKMSGEARGIGNTANYAAVAQQARVFSDSGDLINVLVSDLNLGTDNNVVFNISASVRPELLSYTEAIKNSTNK